MFRDEEKTESTTREDRTEEDQAVERVHPLSALQVVARDISPRTQSLFWLHGHDPESTW